MIRILTRINLPPGIEHMAETGSTSTLVVVASLIDNNEGLSTHTGSTTEMLVPLLHITVNLDFPAVS